MKVQIYTYIALLPTVVGSTYLNVYADNEPIKNGAIAQTDELIKQLPTALLDNLHRDLIEQEAKSQKSIDSIAGISRSKIENEIMRRHNEDRSQTMGIRKISPEALPGALLKYIAERGVSYEGCSPQDAMNEMHNRTGIVNDLPGVLATQIQAEYIKSQQKKAGEEFAARETAEDLHDTVAEIKETAEQGKDPALVKQAEYVKQQEETVSDTTDNILKNVADGENTEPPPHGYDAKIQNNRSSEEIREAEKAVEERNLVPQKTEEGFFSSVWNGIKRSFSNWFNGTEEQHQSDNNITQDVGDMTKAVTDAINEAE